MGRLKRWWYFSKPLTITIASFNSFNCLVKLQRNLELKFRSKFNHDLTNHGYLHSDLKILYDFKIKRGQEQRHNQFFFQNLQSNEIFEIFKMFKNNSWINVYCTKVNAYTPWTACSVFNWKYLFWVNLVQKLKIISLSWNFVPRLIQICRIPWWCLLFLFSTGHTFLGKFAPENQNWQFRTRLIWICRTM